MRRYVNENARGRGKTWQTEKSDFTRIRVLEATVECFAEMTLKDSSIATISKRAGVSRGAMQHHFPSRAVLLESTVNYINLKRLNTWRADLQSVPPGSSVIDFIIDVHWKHLNDVESIAYRELVMAARTDKQLCKFMEDAYANFEKRWHEISVEAFPAWGEFGQKYDLACHACQYLLEGMTYGRINGQLAAGDIDDLLEFAKNILRSQIGDFLGRDSRLGERKAN